MRKTGHAGNCTIYSPLINGGAEEGIRTCGYGAQVAHETGSPLEMYSDELKKKLEEKSGLIKKIEGGK